MSKMFGSVSKHRYDEIVTQGRKLVATKTSVQFGIGDLALEIEGLHEPHEKGVHRPGPGEEVFTVTYLMAQFADDIGLAPTTVETYRWVAGNWPKQHRIAKVSFEVHRILTHAKEGERFELIKNPPDGRRWTPDAARRAVGHRPATAVSTQERVEAIHKLAGDDQVAARVATDFLRRPEVASRVVADPTARFLVNSAQVDRSKITCEIVRGRTPAVAQLQHTAEFMSLVGACQAFTAAVGRVIPTLRGHEFTPDEKATVHANVARVRATADWVESAVDSGNMTLDEGFARLLRSE